MTAAPPVTAHRLMADTGSVGRRRLLARNVFDEAVERMAHIYEGGHRVVCSFSGGKDSGVCLEVCIIAATMAGRLPVDVIMRDEEIMYPGTFEYAERVAARPEVAFRWIVANQPVINVFNRVDPYFWTFDPLLPPGEWVREPPAIAEWVQDMNIESMVHPARFPPGEGKDLFAVIGLRVSESMRRRLSIHSARGHLTKRNPHGTRNCRPIYDWGDGDVWKAIRDHAWDYNHAYDAMNKMGVPARALRIAPPTMNAQSVGQLNVAARAWPVWFDRVCRRLPGVRTAAMFGKRAVQPSRRLGESWHDTFHRAWIEEAPAWIAERAAAVEAAYLKGHRAHAGGAPFPEAAGCAHCSGSRGISSYKGLTQALYGGDPFCLRVSGGMGIVPVDPEFFRPGSGTWGAGKPTW